MILFLSVPESFVGTVPFPGKSVQKRLWWVQTESQGGPSQGEIESTNQ